MIVKCRNTEYNFRDIITSYNNYKTFRANSNIYSAFGAILELLKQWPPYRITYDDVLCGSLNFFGTTNNEKQESKIKISETSTEFVIRTQMDISKMLSKDIPENSIGLIRYSTFFLN